MAAKNPCAKRMTPEEAYEIWESANGMLTYFVLKKYQSPEKEAKNPYARWHCFVKHPGTSTGDYGDVYVSTVKEGTYRIGANPLHRFFCVKETSTQALLDIGLSKYPVSDLSIGDTRLWKYLKISVVPKDYEKVKRLLEEHEIAIVCIDRADFFERCLEDLQTSGE